MADIVYGPPGVGERHRDLDETTYLGAILKRTSWGAIIAGAVTTISVQMILTVLGLAIGVTAAEVNSDPDYRVRTGVQMAAAVWWLVTGTLALLAGGCVVGRFAGMNRSSDVLLHGFTMWAVTALLGLLMVVSGAGALYAGGLNSTYAGAQAFDRPELAGSAADTPAAGEADRDAAAPETDARTEPVTEQEAARYVRTASWWTLLGLMLGLGASLVGSWVAAPHRIVVKPTTQP